jgi:ankyrin repeat protein
MLRTPYHAAVQQNLILSLQPDNPACKSFLDQCNNLDRDIILSTRDLRMEFHNLTLLHMAARMGLTKAIEQLLSLGQEIDVIDTSVSKRTPLFEAISAGQEDAVYMLIKFGAQLGHQDVNGENAFHYAAKVGARMLKVLYSNCDLNKADVQKLLSVTNIKLQFPEDRAVNSLTKEVLVDLRQYGSRQVVGGKNKTARKTKNRLNNKTTPPVSSPSNAPECTQENKE